MMRVLTTTQMRDADRTTIDAVGLPSIVLMENAGRQVVDAMEQQVSDLYGQRIAVVCGKGHNGGDGFVVARLLASAGAEVSVYLAVPETAVRGDARQTLSALRALDLDVADATEPDGWAVCLPQIASADLIVDALFGTGLSRPLAGHWAEVVDTLNATGVPIVAIDLPSGLSADTGQIIGPTIDAALTVTLGAPKVPLLVPPAATRVGELAVADIGIPESVIAAVAGPRTVVITEEWARAQIDPRPDELHKGECGRVLIVAGSTGKTGAARLTGAGALRSGAGLVTIATPRACQDVVSALMPEYMTLGLDTTPAGTIDLAAVDAVLAERCDVLAIGPGLGQTPEVRQVVRALVARSTVPLVLDADALNAFIDEPQALLGGSGRTVIVTPHPGEMARLIDRTVEDVQDHRLEVARDFATSHRLYVVLKGARTLVAAPDGEVLINMTGNPGMATGGTGDVLTGVVAAWLARGMEPLAAAALAVHLHGMAGDLAAGVQGEVGMIATDLASQLGPAVQRVTGTQPDRGVGSPETP